MMKESMRASTFALLAPVLFAGALVAQSNPENPKFTIVISADKPEVTLGADITIAITITNISEEEISIACGYSGRVQDGYQYDMRDEQGAAVARFGPRYRKMPDGSMFRLPDRYPGDTRIGGCGIKPGGFMYVYSTISDEYNFDHPGKYTIRVWKPAKMGTPEKPELDRIYSNTITVAVVAPEPAPDTSK
jgi:hypothetical protein